MIRVLHVEYGVGFGGSAISLSELVRGLSVVGATESTILTFQAPGLVPEGAYEGVRLLRWRRHLSYQSYHDLLAKLNRLRVPRPIRVIVEKAYAFAHVLYEAILSVRIGLLARRLGVDVLHANNGWDASALWAARIAGIRCVVHFRGFPAAQRGTVRSRHGAVVDRVVTRYIGISYSVSEAILAFGAPKEKIRSIANPVTVKDFVNGGGRRAEIRDRHSFSESDVVLGVFGRVTAWKGQVELLAALRDTMSECPSLRVLVVGDESDSEDTAYADRLHALVAEEPFLEKVVVAGFQADVAGYFSSCDVVVHCSRTPEPFGRVVIEAMAASRAVIAMNEGGPPEIITHGVDGLLVAPRDDQQLVEEIKKMYFNSEDRSRLGVAAFETVSSRYSAEQIAKQVVECFAATS